MQHTLVEPVAEKLALKEIFPSLTDRVLREDIVSMNRAADARVPMTGDDVPIPAAKGSSRISDERGLWLSCHVLPHEPALRAWLKGRRVAGFDVDDIVQETYARLAALHSVADVRNPRTYAFQTAYAIVVTHLRRRRVVPIHVVADLEELEATSHPFSPERELESRDELLQLARIIGSLPDKCREVFVLRRVDGLSQREVAERLGLAESTIEKHMARGIRALMDVFGRGEKVSLASSGTSQPRTQQHGKQAVEPGD